MNAGEILAGLGLEQTSPGTWCGDGGWLADADAPLIESINPSTGEVISRVRATSAADAPMKPSLCKRSIPFTVLPILKSRAPSSKTPFTLRCASSAALVVVLFMGPSPPADPSPPLTSHTCSVEVVFDVSEDGDAEVSVDVGEWCSTSGGGLSSAVAVISTP